MKRHKQVVKSVVNTQHASNSPTPTLSTNVDSQMYESPLKKMKKSMSQHPQEILTTIDEIRDFINSNDVSNPDVRSSVRIRARLLWMSEDTVRSFDHAGNTTQHHFLRLYLGEEQAPEPIEQQQQEYQDAQKQDAMHANQYLITTSLYQIDLADPRLPGEGSVITFTPTKMRIYHNCVQLDTKLHNITVATKPLKP
ncbi:hypothetical protein F444_08310 [Phytophthora nicotianae P1976]|uniref:Uncharacterized protein n=1 Tax=Phytophthora nicotianae P1976 TaxID=1317066 RepID=A0A081ABL2_PHYNI|nr:hypothetical protein F444_08310 [Phytophthora nicotianae P1976]